MEAEIEIWLDDNQDQSVEAIMALIQEALESKSKKQPASSKQPPKQRLLPNSVEFNGSSYWEENLDVPYFDELLCSALLTPVKNKRMSSPMGKHTKAYNKEER